ncbi:MAG: hypothetical protein MZU97_24485 [Bacillus subtilis]|nr:hypothetical protein [Bacillus subtilis]
MSEPLAEEDCLRREHEAVSLEVAPDGVVALRLVVGGDQVGEGPVTSSSSK